MTGLVARFRSLVRGIRRREDIEAEMNEEFRTHIAMRAEDLERQGLAGPDALRRAKLEFGSEEQYRDRSRVVRGLATFDRLRVSWLDLKLSVRMLFRYPALTVVAGLAMAFGIWVGASGFELIRQLVYPTLPFAAGDRIVSLKIYDQDLGGDDVQSLYDLELWRESLETMEQVSAWRTVRRNLITGDGQAEPRIVAEMTPSAFAVTGVQAELGRVLVAGDTEPDAPPVVVIGHGIWQSRFGGDPQVIGRTVALDRTSGTIVGVMPEGFGFPIAHEIWTPLRYPAPVAIREDAEVEIFGRLAPGATMEHAAAELSAAGVAMLEDSPADPTMLRANVHPFARAQLGLTAEIGSGSFFVNGFFISSNLPPIGLLLLIGGNVALLLYARAASREADLVVRTALGASRGRLVMQLFAEALVLGGLATALGLAVAGRTLGWSFAMLEPIFGSQVPFWFRTSLSPETVLYAALLTLLMAIMAGVLPALKLTRSLAGRMKAVTAGGGGVRLGGVWSVIIVLQIAMMLVFPTVALVTRDEGMEHTANELPFPSDEFLTVRLELSQSVGTGEAESSRYVEVFEELESSLEGAPGVAGVTFTQNLPRVYHGWNRVEVSEGSAEPRDERGHMVGRTAVPIDFFDVLGTGVAGREFHSGDLAADSRAVIVNETFVAEVLGGRNAIGRHLRIVADESDRTPREGEWYEIVGVASDLGIRTGFGNAGIYFPSVAGAAGPTHMLVHVRGRSPELFSSRIRQAALVVDPELQLLDLQPLDHAAASERMFYDFWVTVATLVSASAVLLALAGIYSAMSFAVARRTREIGVRRALGARPPQIIGVILRRPLTQVGLGVALGALLVAMLLIGPFPERRDLATALVVGAYALGMLGVCLLASIVPARRALSVEPTEALRADA